MSFAKYLLEKGLINASHIVEASIDQLNAQRELLDILYSDLAVPAEQLLPLILKQMESGLSFDLIQNEEPLLDSGIFEKAKKIQKDHVLSIGVYLRSKNILDEEKYFSVINEYHQYKNSNSVEIEKSEAVEKNEKVAVGGETLSSAALDSLRELVAQGLLPQSSLDELENENKPAHEASSTIGGEETLDLPLELISKSKYDKEMDSPLQDYISEKKFGVVLKSFQKVIQFIEQKDLEGANTNLEMMYHEFYRLKGMARLAGAKILESLLELNCAFLKKIQAEKDFSQLKTEVLLEKKFITDFFSFLKDVTKAQTEDVITNNIEMNRRANSLVRDFNKY